MVLAVAFASMLPAQASIGSVQIAVLCGFVGTLFVNSLKMLVVPLIAASLVAAVAQLGEPGSFGRMFGKLMLCICATSLIAALIGMTLVNLIQPGHVAKAAVAAAAAVSAAPSAGADIVETLLGIVPPNVLRAASNDQLLSIVFFSLLFGVCAVRLPPAERQIVTTFARAIFEVMIHIARLILRCAPLGVFCLLLAALMTHGLSALVQLGLYVVTVLCGLLLHAAIVLPLVLLLLVRVSPWRFFRAVLAPILTAFSTASSKAALAVSFDALETRVGVSARVTRFSLPLSATMNMNGTALYECVAAVFVAQFFGIDLSIGAQVSIVLVALLTTLGNAGVPGGGVIGLTMVLSVANLPAEGIAMVLAVDRVLDMSRTAVNVWGDAVTAAVIAASEGESLFAAGRTERVAVE